MLPRTVIFTKRASFTKNIFDKAIALSTFISISSVYRYHQPFLPDFEWIITREILEIITPRGHEDLQAALTINIDIKQEL